MYTRAESQLNTNCLYVACLVSDVGFPTTAKLQVGWVERMEGGSDRHRQRPGDFVARVVSSTEL